MRAPPGYAKLASAKVGGLMKPGFQSREAIFAAARQLFAKRGFNGTTTRSIAAKARVDVALVHYFFQTKAKLFAAAVDVPIAPEELEAMLGDAGGGPVGERVVRFFLPWKWYSPADEAACTTSLVEGLLPLRAQPPPPGGTGRGFGAESPRRRVADGALGARYHPRAEPGGALAIDAPSLGQGVA